MKIRLPKSSHSEEASLVSKIYPKYRRFDELAGVLDRNDANQKTGNVSLSFDGRNFLFSTNITKINSVQKKCLDYLQYLTNLDYNAPNLYAKINEQRQSLYKAYADANPTSKQKGALATFKQTLMRLEGSIIGSIIKNDPNAQKKVKRLLFNNQADFIREESIFPTEYITAINKGVKVIAGSEQVHSELKIVEYLLRKRPQNAGPIPNVYLASAKKCCVNCENVIKAFNKVIGPRDQVSYGSDETLSSDAGITTRDLLTTGHGHGSQYPSAIPPFLLSPNRTSPYEVELRDEFVRLNGGKTLEDIFYNTKIIRPIPITRQISMGSPTVTKVVEMLDANLDANEAIDLVEVAKNISAPSVSQPSELENLKLENIEQEADKTIPPVIDPVLEERKLTAKELKKLKEDKAKAIRKEEKQARKLAKAAIQQEQQKEQEKHVRKVETIVETVSQEQPEEGPQRKPTLFIIYDTDTDSTATCAITDILETLHKNYNIGSILFEEPPLELDRNLEDAKRFERHFRDLAKNGKKQLDNQTRNIDKQIRAKIIDASTGKNHLKHLESQTESIKTFEDLSQLFFTAGSMKLLAKNISPPIETIDRIEQEDSEKNLQKTEQLMKAVFSQAKININRAFASEAAISLAESVQDLPEREINTHLVNQIDEVCSRTNKSSVLLLKWERAASIEKLLAEKGYEDCRSIFPFNSEKIRNDLLNNSNRPLDYRFMNLFLLRNQEYANAMILPDITLLDEQATSKKERDEAWKIFTSIEREREIAIPEAKSEEIEDITVQEGEKAIASLSIAEKGAASTFVQRLAKEGPVNSSTIVADEKDKIIVEKALNQINSWIETNQPASFVDRVTSANNQTIMDK